MIDSLRRFVEYRENGKLPMIGRLYLEQLQRCLVPAGTQHRC